MRKKQSIILLPFTLMLLLLLTIESPAYGASHSLTAASLSVLENNYVDSGSAGKRSAAPVNRPISSLVDLLNWHNAPLIWNEYPVLTEDIIVNRPIVLTETKEQMFLGVIEHVIRVTAGGSLTLNNSELIIQGPGPVIVVESGGRLLLKGGSIYAVPDKNAVVVEKGGQLTLSAGFNIEGKVMDKNQQPVEPDTDPLPPNLEEKPSPPQNPAFPAIQNTLGLDYSLSCMVGEPPALSDYPATEWVFYETTVNHPVQKELSVQWELDTVDFQTAGTYEVKGIFTADVLAVNGLSNPKGLSSTLQLTVIKPGPIEVLTGNVLSIGSRGNCQIRLAIPLLPEGATALYIYRSADGKHWKKATKEAYINGNIPITYDNFLPHVKITPKSIYVRYDYQTDYGPIWFRVEVVGSAVAGVSNTIKLKMPSSAKPGDVIHTGETGDDGGSGGNRGGVGQSESSRQLPNAQEQPVQGQISFPSGQAPAVSTTQGLYNRQTQGGGTPIITKADKGIPESKPPVSSFSNTRQKELNTASPSVALSIMEQEALLAAGPADSEGAAGQTLLNQTRHRRLQKSSGILLTAAATIFVAGGLILLRTIGKNRKKKP